MINIVGITKSGKSTEVVKEAIKENQSIIVVNNEKKNVVKNIDSRVSVYTVEEYLKLSEKPENIMVDDVEGVLEELLGANITTITSGSYSDITFLQNPLVVTDNVRKNIKQI